VSARTRLRHLATARFGPLTMAALKRSNREPSDSFVYFAVDAETLDTKIGIANDPFKRLRTLQIGSPREIVLMGTLAGGRELEQEIHEEFDDDWIRGEWFRMSPRLTHLIAAAWEAGRRRPWETAFTGDYL